MLSLGRTSAIVLMVLLAVAVFRIWRKNGPVMLAMAKVPDNAKWANYHILWFGPHRAAVCLALAALQRLLLYGGLSDQERPARRCGS